MGSGTPQAFWPRHEANSMAHPHCHLLKTPTETVREYRPQFLLRQARQAWSGNFSVGTKQADRRGRGIRNASGQGEPTSLA